MSRPSGCVSSDLMNGEFFTCVSCDCIKRRHLLGVVREPYGLHERGGARGDQEVHLLRGGDVQAVPNHRPLPQVFLALPAFLETVCGSLGLPLQSR